MQLHVHSQNLLDSRPATTTRLPPPVQREALLVLHRDITEGLREPLLALAVLHARRCRIVHPTRTVDHVVQHDLVQRRPRFRQFGAHNAVKVIGVQHAEAALEDDEDVGMRQPPLLPLHSHQIALHFSKNAILHKLVDQLLQPQVEHPGHQVRAVVRRLPMQQVGHDLWPLGVAREGDKKVGLPELPHNGHTILVQLLQIAWAPRKRGAKDDSPTKKAGTSTSGSIKPYDRCYV